MSEYLRQATEFLRNANATCNIEFGGVARNENWKGKDKRNWYDVVITTPKGTMSFVFWDSIHNTEITAMTLEQYVEKNLKRRLNDMSYAEKIKANKKLKQEKTEAVPNAYDVLACLQKYDVGTFEDFCSEFGYDEDSRTAERIYFAVQKEYKELASIFTEEQMEELCEIQ